MPNGNGKLAAGLILGAGLGLMFGYVLPKQEDVAGLRGGAADAGLTSGADADALAAAKAESGRLAAEVEALRAKLAAGGDAPAIVEKPTDRPPLKPATEGKKRKTGDPKVDWDAKKKAAAATGTGKGRGNNGKAKPSLTEPPDGLTREQWDEAVRVIVDGTDWGESLSAIRRLGNAKSSGQAMEPADLAHWESMQQTWRALGDLGVGRNDPRVLRAVVPGWTSALGANLSEGQAAQLGTTVEELARREAARPAPAVPERFATTTARQLRNVIALEHQMASLLHAEQFQAYLGEVGDDPFASGWRGGKPWRRDVSGTPDELAAQAAGHWSNHYDLTEPAQRAVVQREASAFAAAVASVAGPVDGMDAVQRRRTILERTARVAELQGAAEERFLTTGLGLSGEALNAALSGQAPVFIIDAR